MTETKTPLKSKKSQSVITILLLVVIVLIVSCLFVYMFTHNKSYKNEAVERGEDIYLNGVRYSYVNMDLPYTITNARICKTDKGTKLYEIEEYPDYEYIAGYRGWDGEIYQRVSEDGNQ